jgi:phosphohistidine swiveling domain-containing protein
LALEGQIGAIPTMLRRLAGSCQRVIVHSLIVARECHVPAVLGPGVATAWISSGQLVTLGGEPGP